MKKQLKSLLLVVVLIGYAMPILAQSSTEGKEFWVGLTLTCKPPDDGDGEASPYLAISTKTPANITISNPAYPAQQKRYTIPANTWRKIDDIPLGWWYPSGVGKPSAVIPHADQINNYGIRVESDVNISVFAVVRADAAMDASNILPITAISQEYILQDYVPMAKSDNSNKPYMVMTTILATEDNTAVKIKPSCDTYNNTHAKGVEYTVNLNKGQTYYLMANNDGTNNNCLTGTEVTSNNKIAVFQGSVCTFIPTGVGNRDCLYEQAMPVEYWGTHFVATRSYAKGAVFIRITASTDGTTIDLNGQPATKADGTAFVLNRGETYEIQLAASSNLNNADKVTRQPDKTIIGDHIYIETSCPCAVYSYDVGKSYSDKAKAELDPGKNEQQGDPSSVWIAPLEQSIDQITFGPCGTNITENHYLDIVVLTEFVDQTVITPAPKDPNYNPNNVGAIFHPVTANNDYSYARIYLAKADDQSKASFTISNPGQFVAHVYGNGTSESYSYSVGSAAVQRGVKVNGMTFNDGYRSDKPFCLDSVFHFNAKVGTDEITRVDWDFGDGTTEDFGGLQTTHVYTSPGWYDVTANRYGQQVCTNIPESDLGPVTFSFYVRKADTIMVEPKDSCLSLKQQDSIIAKEGKAYLDNLVQNGQREIINDDAPCYEDKLVSMVFYGLETEETKDTITGNDYAVGYNGKGYDTPTDVTDTAYNSSGCYHFVHYFMNILSCVDLTFLGSEERHICPGEDLRVDYDFAKGSLKDIDDDGHNAVLKVAGHKDQFFTIPNENTKRPVLYYPTMTLPTSGIKKPGHYFAQIEVEDEHCKQTKTIPIDFYVDYPKNIMKYKFNNVIAVYKPEHGGNDGYEFTNYEWHLVRNSQDTILAAGPNMDVLYLGEGTTFEKGDLVYVILTDKGGVIGPLRSCKLEIENVPNYDTTSNQNPAPATKRMVNRQIIIEKGDQSYNIYGQRVR